jgi:hypothetical protein
MKKEEAKPGTRVQCVNADFVTRGTDPFSVHDLALPKKGEVYTIRRMVETYEGHPPGLLLSEVRNKCYSHSKGGLKEPCFSLERFEPI